MKNAFFRLIALVLAICALNSNVYGAPEHKAEAVLAEVESILKRDHALAFSADGSAILLKWALIRLAGAKWDEESRRRLETSTLPLGNRGDRNVLIEIILDLQPDFIIRVFDDFPRQDKIDFDSAVAFLVAHRDQPLIFELAVRTIGREYRPNAETKAADELKIRAAFGLNATDSPLNDIQILVAHKLLRRHSADGLLLLALKIRRQLRSDDNIHKGILYESRLLLPRLVERERDLNRLTRVQIIKALLNSSSQESAFSNRDAFELIRNKMLPLLTDEEVVLILLSAEASLPDVIEMNHDSPGRLWMNHIIGILYASPRPTPFKLRSRVRLLLDRIADRLPETVRFESLHGRSSIGVLRDWSQLRREQSRLPWPLYNCVSAALRVAKFRADAIRRKNHSTF